MSFLNELDQRSQAEYEEELRVVEEKMRQRKVEHGRLILAERESNLQAARQNVAELEAGVEEAREGLRVLEEVTPSEEEEQAPLDEQSEPTE